MTTDDKAFYGQLLLSGIFTAGCVVMALASGFSGWFTVGLFWAAWPTAFILLARASR